MTTFVKLVTAVGALAVTAGVDSIPSRYDDRPAASVIGEQAEHADDPGIVADLALSLSRDGSTKMASLLVTGLAPGQRVRIGSGLVASEYELIDWGIADASGRLSWRAPVEPWYLGGEHWVLVIATPNGDRLAVSNPVSIDDFQTGDNPEA